MWQQQILETLVVITRWRRGAAEPARAWTPSQAAAAHAAGVQRVFATLAHRLSADHGAPATHSQLVTELRALLAAADPLPASPPQATGFAHILFFDGGSRGNLGPGGSGACVVRVEVPTRVPTLVWSASMSHAHRSTTNNQAEYQGLLHGLRAAHRYKWPGLEVVGDSNLILTQHRHNRPPRNQRLLRLYAQTRRLADQVGVARWTHHIRAHNKMADALANLAMDTSSSTQIHHPTTRPGHVDLSALLRNDLVPWLPGFLECPVE